MKMSLAETRNVVKKDDRGTRENEHDAGKDEIVGEGVDNEEKDKREESLEKEWLANLIEAILFLDDGVGTFADGLKGFIESKKHDNDKFISVIAAENAEKEGKDEHSGTAPEASVEIIRVGDFFGSVGNLKSATTINTDDIKNTGGGEGERKDAGVIDTVEASGEHQKEKWSEIPASGANEIPNKIAAESGSGGETRIFCF